MLSRRGSKARRANSRSGRLAASMTREGLEEFNALLDEAIRGRGKH